MRFDPYLSLHDFYIHIACQRVSKEFDAVIAAADGGSMFFEDLPSECPTILGYRPDAVATFPGGAFLIEVKSQEDFNSRHSHKQYRIINQLLAEKTHLALYLYVFNSNAANTVPVEFSDEVCHRVILEQT